jgi:hypothetical protein
MLRLNGMAAMKNLSDGSPILLGVDTPIFLATHAEQFTRLAGGCQDLESPIIATSRFPHTLHMLGVGTGCVVMKVGQLDLSGDVARHKGSVANLPDVLHVREATTGLAGDVQKSLELGRSHLFIRPPEGVETILHGIMKIGHRTSRKRYRCGHTLNMVNLLIA